MATTATAVADRLVEMARGIAPDGVQVFDGSLADSSTRDNIALVAILDGNQQYVVHRHGSKPRQEEYLVEFAFTAQRAGKTGSTAARVAATDLWAALTDEVAKDPQLGMGDTYPTLVCEPGKFDIVTKMDGTTAGARAVVMTKFRVSARIPNP